MARGSVSADEGQSKSSWSCIIEYSRVGGLVLGR